MKVDAFFDYGQPMFKYSSTPVNPNMDPNIESHKHAPVLGLEHGDGPLQWPLDQGARSDSMGSLSVHLEGP
jgi:hypothetical protein